MQTSTKWKGVKTRRDQVRDYYLSYEIALVGKFCATETERTFITIKLHGGWELIRMASVDAVYLFHFSYFLDIPHYFVPALSYSISNSHLEPHGSHTHTHTSRSVCTFFTGRRNLIRQFCTKVSKWAAGASVAAVSVTGVMCANSSNVSHLAGNN